MLSRSSRLFRLRIAKYSVTPASTLSDLQLSQNVTHLADNLCALNLLETAQLVSLLQKRLNLNPLAASAFGANSGSLASSGTLTSTVEAPKIEKTEFKATLQKFDPVSKAKIIREIKLILPQLNLVEAKSFVESAPKMIKEKLKKDEAEKIKKTLEDLGATITLE